MLTKRGRPHDGRGATQRDYIRALRQGYNLSLPLATFLTVSGHVLLAQYSHLSLADFSRHNFIEHDASLGHWDALATQEYAPDLPSRCLLNHTLKHSSDGRTMSMRDFTEARQERESAYPGRALDPLHEEIARGEMSMVLGIFGKGNDTVPVPWIQEWWLNERFPIGRWGLRCAIDRKEHGVAFVQRADHHIPLGFPKDLLQRYHPVCQIFIFG